MKTKLIIVLLVAASFQIKAQDYVFLVAENQNWSTLTVWTYEWPDTTYFTTYHKFEGDSIIGEFQYLKVFETQSEDMSDWVLIGCIREDEDKKVWYKSNDIEEGILYDFDLQVGETITIGDNPELTVDSIKSISVNGTLRNQYFLSNSFATEIWIEGIGSLLGVLKSGLAGTVGGYTVLLCKHKNNEFIWQNPYYYDCWLISSINKLAKNKLDINIYPNPSNKYITIETDRQAVLISITDIIGKEIYKSQNSVCKAQISIEKLVKGIYLINIYQNNRLIETKKLIKL